MSRIASEAMTATGRGNSADPDDHRTWTVAPAGNATKPGLGRGPLKTDPLARTPLLPPTAGGLDVRHRQDRGRPVLPASNLGQCLATKGLRQGLRRNISRSQARHPVQVPVRVETQIFAEREPQQAPVQPANARSGPSRGASPTRRHAARSTPTSYFESVTGTVRLELDKMRAFGLDALRCHVMACHIGSVLSAGLALTRSASV